MPSPLSLPGKIVDARFVRPQIDYDLEIAHLGQGQWRAFRSLGLELSPLLEIASSWGRSLDGLKKPWLCWNVDHDWCYVQQQLVSAAGWTPLVGFDPRVGPPRRRVPQAVVFDFNSLLQLPVLYPHFPLEFAFMFCERLAFWHSDLLLRRQHIDELCQTFTDLPDGATAACWVSPGWRHALTRRRRRYWELVGCTTRQASLDQFRRGCGWWMAYWAHPHQRQGNAIRKSYYWDHGAGIYYWHTREGGNCLVLPGRRFEEGHFTKIGNKNYTRTIHKSGSDAERNMGKELSYNFDLAAACASLDLHGLVPLPTS